MNRRNGFSDPRLIPNVAVELNDDQRQKVWGLLGGMMNRSNALFEMGKHVIQPDWLPRDMKMEKAFLRIFYALNHDRSPAQDASKSGNNVTITPQDMAYNLGLEFGSEAAQEFVDKMRNFAPELGTLYGVAKGLASWINSRRGKQAFMEAADEFDGVIGDDETQWARAMEIVNKAAPRPQTVEAVEGTTALDTWVQGYEMRRKLAAQGKATGPIPPWGLGRKIATIKKGELVGLAARSSFGKSTVALQLAHHWAHKQGGYDVAYFYLETLTESQLDRLVSSEIRVTTQDLRKPKGPRNPNGFDLFGDKPNEKQAKELFDQFRASYLKNCEEKGRVWLVHCPGLTPAEFEAQVAAYSSMSRAKGREFIAIVDYYSLLSEQGLGVNGKQEWAKNDARAHFFKEIAEQYKVYMVVLAQDNMNADYSNHQRKTSKSGSALFERCQVFMRIDREYAEADLPVISQNTGQQITDSAGRPMYWHRKGQPRSDAFILIEKGSDDETGKVPIKFLSAYFQIKEVATNVNQDTA
jgi:replicative DNA helicase